MPVGAVVFKDRRSRLLYWGLKWSERVRHRQLSYPAGMKPIMRPWRADFGPDWTRLAIARSRYSRTNNVWTLYFFDRNNRHQRYTLLEPTADVGVLLDEIDADPTAIFWG